MYKSNVNQGQSQGHNGFDLEKNLKTTFVESLQKISNEINGSELIVSQSALLFIETLLFKLFSILTRNSPKLSSDLEDNVLKLFPSPNNKNSIKYTQSKLKNLNNSEMIEKIQLILMKDVLGYKVDANFVKYLIATLEYIASVIFEITGNYVKNMKHHGIEAEDVKIAINADHFLMALLYGEEDEDDDDAIVSHHDDEEMITDEDDGMIVDDPSQQQHFKLQQHDEIVGEEYFHIIKMILNQERTFSNVVKITMKIFRDPFISAAANRDEDAADAAAELEEIFSNIEDIYEFSLNFLGLIEDVIEMNGLMMIGCVFEELLEQQEFDCFERFTEDYFDNEKQFKQTIEHKLLPKIATTQQQQQQQHKLFQSHYYWLLIKYLLPIFYKEIVQHSLNYYEYMKILKPITKNDEDREAFKQSEGLLRPLIKKIEKKLKSNNLIDTTDNLMLKKFRRKPKSNLDQQKLISLIDGLDTQTKQLLKNSQLIYQGIVYKVRLQTNRFVESTLIRKRNLDSQNLINSERYAFLFDSHLILTKEEQRQQQPMQQEDNNTNDDRMNVCDEQHDNEQQQLNNDDDDSSEIVYKFKEKLLLRKYDLFECSSDANCLELKETTTSSSLTSSTIVIKLKSLDEKQKWFARLLLLKQRFLIDKTIDEIIEEELKQNPLKLPSKEEYIFNEEDSNENIIFEQQQAKQQQQQQQQTIKAATLLKLIERLTYHLNADPNLIKIFLQTYRSFVDSFSLLNLLIQRFNIPLIEGNREQLKRYKKQFLEPIQFRVLNVIRLWIDLHFNDDFRYNHQLKQSTIEFLQSIVNRNMNKWVQSILKIIRRKEECDQHEHDLKVKYFSIQPPKIEYWLTTDFNKFNLITLHPLEFGRQLTLYEFQLYCQVKCNELIGLKWMNEETKEKDAPNLMKMIKHSNNFTYFLAKEILTTPNFDERCALTSRIVEILQVLLDLNNFNGILEIISALNLSCVYRLEHTMSSLSYKQRKIIDEMQELNSDHYKKYQERLRSINPPCVPFFGIYLTNILHLEEGNQDYTDQQCKLINFSKQRKIAEITTEIQQYQQQPYCLQVSPDIQQYIQCLDPIKGGDKKAFEDYLYEQSLLIEPRNTPKPFKGGQKRFSEYTLKSPGIKTSSSGKPSSLSFVPFSTQIATTTSESNSPLISPKTPPNNATTAISATTMLATTITQQQQQQNEKDSVFAKVFIPSSSSSSITASSSQPPPSQPPPQFVSTPPPLPPRITNSSKMHQRTSSESSCKSHTSPTASSPAFIGQQGERFTFNFSIPPPAPPSPPPPPPPPPPRPSRSSCGSMSESPPPPLPPRGISQAAAHAALRNSTTTPSSILSPPPRRNSSSLSPPPCPPPPVRRSSSCQQPSLPPRTHQQRKQQQHHQQQQQ